MGPGRLNGSVRGGVLGGGDELGLVGRVSWGAGVLVLDVDGPSGRDRSGAEVAAVGCVGVGVDGSVTAGHGVMV